MSLYVGNLPYETTEDDLKQLFSEYGNVSDVKVIIDRETNRSKGFGFVTMENESDNDSAIQNLDGREVSGRAIKVNPAQPKFVY